MRTTRLLPTVLLGLALAACDPPDDEAAGPDAGPPPAPEAPTSTDEVRTDEVPASDVTTATTGITRWRRTLERSGAATVVGVDAAGATVATIAITPADPSLGEMAATLTITGAHAATLTLSLASSAPDVADALAGNPIAAAYDRDVADQPVPEVERPAGALYALTAAQRTERRNLMKCMVTAAAQAYEPRGSAAAVCGWTYLPAFSTDVMKVWRRAPNLFVIGFAGTRLDPTRPGASLGDVWRDVQSQSLVDKTDPLTGQTLAGVKVGRGWDLRWRGQAAANNGAVRNLLRTVRTAPGYAEIVVVGHSLGAATATVAGYDIAQYLRLKPSHTYVYAFNPPRTGGSSFRDRFQDAMFGAGGAKLTMRQFTVMFDPVQSVPLTHTHPVWQTAYNRANTGIGPRGGQALGYCPQLGAWPRVWIRFWPPSWGSVGETFFRTLYNNHTPVTLWNRDIDRMPDSHVDCMFERRW